MWNTIKYYKVHTEARKCAQERKQSVEVDSEVVQWLELSNQDFKSNDTNTKRSNGKGENHASRDEKFKHIYENYKI